MRKNKTIATWLALIGGPLGLHRFYLRGWGDLWGWIAPLPTALGLYGVQRMQQFGQDDQWSWALIPLLGLSIAASALTAIVYGLRSPEKWQAQFHADGAPTAADRTNWFTVVGVAAALLLGTGVLMASLAFSFQRYFEYQIEEARKISQ
jgi:hypothetical protein